MSRYKEVYCILKHTEWDYYQAHEARAARFKRLSQEQQQQIQESYKNQITFVDNLKNFTHDLKMNIHYVDESEMDQIQPTVDDLVVSCGGDGMFLSCAQAYPDSVLLGMNSDYSPKEGQGSYGALTSTSRANLRSRLTSLLGGHFFIDHWQRLQASVNGERIDRLAVNDIYYGAKIAYRTCSIHISQSGLQQSFNCSGLLCCTGMGSHAWHFNAGGSPFSNELDAFGFRVLFPNLKYTLKFTSGIVSKRHDLVICPEREGYVLSFDSKADVIETELGDEIKISIAHNRALKVVSFVDD